MSPVLIDAIVFTILALLYSAFIVGATCLRTDDDAWENWRPSGRVQFHEALTPEADEAWVTLITYVPRHSSADKRAA